VNAARGAAPDPGASGDNWHAAVGQAALPAGSVVGCTIAGREIAVCRLEDGSLHAIGNVCTHEHARLSEGWLLGSVLSCPFHGGQFDVRTGAGVCGPIERPVEVYAVDVRAGMVRVRVR
jgi:naphthalene 1,2-dioxygenase system ferredoxin subunit